MIKVSKPRWPVGQLATFELRNLRAELEHVLTRAPEHTAERQLLEERLAEVIGEQDTRAAAEADKLTDEQE